MPHIDPNVDFPFPDLPTPPPPPTFPPRGPAPGPIGTPVPPGRNPFEDQVVAFLCALGGEPVFGPSCAERGFRTGPFEPEPSPPVIPSTPPFVPPVEVEPVLGPFNVPVTFDPIQRTIEAIGAILQSVFQRGPLVVRPTRVEGAGGIPPRTFPRSAVGDLIPAAA